MLKRIVKRNGELEDFIPHKVNGWGIWASETLGDKVDWSSVVLNTIASLPEEVDSQTLQLALIETCIDNDTWSYQKMAGRLFAAYLHKKITPVEGFTLLDLHTQLFNEGIMVKLNYTDKEYAYLNSKMDHTRDFNCTHFELKQIREKYSLKNRVTSKEYETQQYVYMRMAMTLAEDEGEKKLEECLNWFEEFSMKRLSAPTPNYVNLGTHLKGFASCCVYTTEDTVSSLFVGDHIAGMMTSQSAGIGSHINSRSIGDPVRKGLLKHNGKLPSLRALVSAIQVFTQNGRGGAATTYYNAFDPEVEVINKLKNPMSTEDKKIRGIDYAMCSNKFIARKVARNEQMFTFNSFTAPDLYESFYGKDENQFATLYNQYEANPFFKKNYVSAREVVLTALNEAYETGKAFLFQADEANKHTPFKEPIYSSNLCVAPETPILTKEFGYRAIKELSQFEEGVTIWNGKQWSPNVVIKQTGTNQKLLSVVISDGTIIEATPYHRWSVIVGDDIVIKETKDLSKYDKLIKFDLVTLDHGVLEIPVSYGTIFLDKDIFIPNNTYSLKSRLNWLSYVIETFGIIKYFNNNLVLEMNSNNPIKRNNTKDLIKLKLVLQELGIHSITTEGILYISNNNMCKLIELGLIVEELDLSVFIPSTDDDMNSALEILSIDDYNKFDDTYCFTEPLRNMGMFNGILTMNCTEIMLPTKGYKGMQELYSKELLGQTTFLDNYGHSHTVDNNKDLQTARGIIKAYNVREGDFCSDTTTRPVTHTFTVEKIVNQDQNPEIGLCSLAAIVISNIHSKEQYDKTMYYGLKMIDKCIHMSDYVFPHLELTAKARLSAGVGIMGYATHLASKGLTYSSIEGKKEHHRVAEYHMYSAIKASLRLGKELGNAPWIDRTKWVDGWLPLDTYNKNVDKIADFEYECNWEALRSAIRVNGGIRNSVLVTQMPGESSSKAIAVPNQLYPVRDITLSKSDNAINFRWAAPNGDDENYFYERAWDVKSKDLIDMYAIFQKFTDQGISADLFRKVIGDDKVTSDEMLDNYLHIVKMGVKSRYYQNTLTNLKPVLQTESAINVSIENTENDEVGCAGGFCSL